MPMEDQFYYQKNPKSLPIPYSIFSLPKYLKSISHHTIILFFIFISKVLQMWTSCSHLKHLVPLRKLMKNLFSKFRNREVHIVLYTQCDGFLDTHSVWKWLDQYFSPKMISAKISVFFDCFWFILLFAIP